MLEKPPSSCIRLCLEQMVDMLLYAKYSMELKLVEMSWEKSSRIRRIRMNRRK